MSSRTRIKRLWGLLKKSSRAEGGPDLHVGDEETAGGSWVDVLIFAQILPWYYRTRTGLGVLSFCAYVNNAGKAISELPLMTGETALEAKFLFKKGLRVPFLSVYLNAYRMTVCFAEMQDLDINNLVYFKVEVGDESYKVPLLYNALDLARGHYRVSPIFNASPNRSFYLRQTLQNHVFLTLRDANVTDSARERRRMRLARLAAFIVPQRKRVLIFEKQLESYEESGAVLFEKLCDLGYRQVRYVIKSTSDQYAAIGEKYRKQVIPAYSWRHYYNVFASRTFFGTEVLQHVFELRCCAPVAQRKLASSANRYVFLQHGVMYMVSLDSPLRLPFNTITRKYRLYRVVVSSQLEAQHFIDSAGFDPSSIYLTGLPNYDRISPNPDADKILIMPTWRAWEYNLALTEPEKTAYYKMMLELYESIPDHLKSKVYLMPHPLVLEAFRHSGLADYIPDFVSYSKLLSDCALLITDYSSIAYAAFYHGAQVLFYWKEKDICLEHYQTHLMIDESTAFGDVCYSAHAVTESVENLYRMPQAPEYLEAFGKIVEFHDGKNTERVIEALKRDKLLS